jgi:hypothetical protein
MAAVCEIPTSTCSVFWDVVFCYVYCCVVGEITDCAVDEFVSLEGWFMRHCRDDDPKTNLKRQVKTTDNNTE